MKAKLLALLAAATIFSCSGGGTFDGLGSTKMPGKPSTVDYSPADSTADPSPYLFRFSPDAKRVLHLKDIQGEFLLFDGLKEGPVLATMEMMEPTLVYFGTLADGTDWSWPWSFGLRIGGKTMAEEVSKTFFSPDGKAMAWEIENGNGIYELWRCDPSGNIDKLGDSERNFYTVAFSPDSCAICWLKAGSGGNQVMLDGRELLAIPSGSIVTDAAFLSASDVVVDVYNNETGLDRLMKGDGTVLLEGKVSGLRAVSGSWSAIRENPNSPEINDPEGRVFLNGAEIPGPGSIQPDSMALSPDGKVAAFVAGPEGSRAYWIDGKKESPEGLDRPASEFRRILFSSDSSSHAYAYLSEEPRAEGIAFNGRAFPLDLIDLSGLCISPDGKRWACMGRDGEGKARIVIDGMLRPESFEAIDERSIRWNDASTRLAFGAVAKEGFSWNVLAVK